MKIDVDNITEEDIQKITEGDLIYYTSGAPQMGGNKINCVFVKTVNATQIIFDDGNGVLKKNIKRGSCLKIIAVEFKNKG